MLLRRFPSVGPEESRMVRWFEELKPNVVTWGADLKDTYIDGPISEGNPVKVAGGIGMIMAETVLRLPDILYAGAVDQHKSAPEGFMGRTRQATGQLIDNIVTLDPHPLRALGNASEIVFSFPWALDLADAAVFDRARSARQEITHALAA
ncbi:hypothetical protein HZA45_02090 [Candidatus Peregrinibacteria bacterium]|nr:hypothetical protein [Candidatus Peregrinibacteria bacterium]